jgi:hypothetical protein
MHNIKTRNLITAFALIVSTTFCCSSASAHSIVGSWKCAARDFEDNLILLENGAYENKTKIDDLLELAETGTWTLKEQLLVLSRSTHIRTDLTTGERVVKSSPFDFKLKIISKQLNSFTAENIDASGGTMLRLCKRNISKAVTRNK